MRALALGLLCWTGLAAAQPADPPADIVPADTLTYTVLTAAGDTTSLDAIVAAMQGKDVVFLGEMHDDATAHALQLRLFEAADTLGRPLALGLEMFERDVQPVLDEYLAGYVRERDFLAAARPWSNYAADYRPLVEYARERGLPVLATNAPGRYTNRTARLGIDSLAVLSSAALTKLPPLPVAPASDTLGAKFTALMTEMMGHGAPPADTTASDSTAAPNPHGVAAHAVMPTVENMLAAQNLRDAAMAWTVAQHIDANPGALVVHLNGSFHSESGLGIPEHLARYRPGVRPLVVTLRPVGDLEEVDDKEGSGNDFVIRTGAGDE